MASGIITPIDLQINNASLRRVEALLAKLTSPKTTQIKFSTGGGNLRPLGQISGDISEIDKSLRAANARILAFTSSTSLIYGVGAAFKRIGKDFIDVEASLASIQALTKSTTAQMKDLGRQGFAVANQIGVPFSEVAEGLEEFARQGLDAEKSLKATSAAASVMRLSGGNLKQAIDGLISVTNSYVNELNSYEEIANKLTSVDAKFATSASGLVEGIKRVGSVASDAGVSLDKTIAAIAAIKQVSGRSESIIGNGLKTIFTNLQTGKVQEELEGLGIATKDANGEFLDSITILTQLASVYDKLTDSQRAAVSLKIAGKFQINNLKSLLTSLKGGGTGIYGQALDTSANAGDEVQARLDILNKTTKSSLQRLNNDITETFANVGEKIAKPIIQSFEVIAKEGLGVLKSAFGDTQLGSIISKGIAGALTGPGIFTAFALLFKLSLRLGKDLVGAFSALTGVGKQGQQILVSNEALLAVLKAQNVLRAQAVALTNQLATATATAATTTARGPGTAVYGGSGAPIGGITRRGPGGVYGVPRPVGRADIDAAVARDNAQQLRDERRAYRVRQNAAAGLLVKQEKQQAAAARRARVNNIAFGLGFAIPFAGAALGDLAGGESTHAGRLTTGIANSAGTGLTAAALFGGGPGGIVAGIGLAGAQAVGAIHAEKYNPKDSIDKFEKAQASLTERENAIQSYIEALATVEDLKTSGASLRSINKATKNVSEFFGKLSSDDIENIAKLGTDREAIGNYAQSAIGQEKRNVLLSGTTKTVAELASQKNTLTEVPRLSKSDLKAVAGGIFGSLDLANINTGTLSDLGNTNNISKQNLKDLGLAGDEVDELFRKLTGGFQDAEKDLGPVLAKLFRDFAISDKLRQEEVKLSAVVDKVSANIGRLTDQVFKRSDAENFSRKLSFTRASGFAKNLIDSQKDTVTEEGLGYASAKLSEAQLSNENSSKLQDGQKEIVKLVKEAADSLTDTSQKLEGLNLLKSFGAGQLSAGELAGKFGALGQRFKGSENVETTFTKFNDKLSEASDQLDRMNREGKVNEEILRHANQLEQQRLSTGMLLKNAGYGRSSDDLRTLLNDATKKIRERQLPNYGSKNVPISKSNAERADEDLARIHAESQFDLSNVADSDLTPDEIKIKRKHEQARIERATQDYRDKFGEQARESNVTVGTDLLDELDKNNPGGLSKKQRQDILDELNSGNPSGASKILGGAQRAAGSKFTELSKPLEEFLKYAEVTRDREEKSARNAAEKEFPTSEVNEETKKHLAEAQQLADTAAQGRITSAIDSSKVSSIDTKIGSILEALTKSQLEAGLKGQISTLASQAAQLEGKRSESYNIPKNSIGTKSVEDFDSFFNFGDYGPQFHAKKYLDVNAEGSQQLPLQDTQKYLDAAREEILQDMKGWMKEIPNDLIVKFGETAGEEATGNKFSPLEGGTLEKILLDFTETTRKLQETLEQKQKLEEELKKSNPETQKATSQVNLNISVDATPELVAALSGDEFTSGLEDYVNSRVGKVMADTLGRRPVFTPTA